MDDQEVVPRTGRRAIEEGMASDGGHPLPVCSDARPRGLFVNSCEMN